MGSDIKASIASEHSHFSRALFGSKVLTLSRECPRWRVHRPVKWP